MEATRVIVERSFILYSDVVSNISWWISWDSVDSSSLLCRLDKGDFCLRARCILMLIIESQTWRTGWPFIVWQNGSGGWSQSNLKFVRFSLIKYHKARHIPPLEVWRHSWAERYNICTSSSFSVCPVVALARLTHARRVQLFSHGSRFS
jgi:hypothetical protein